MGLRRFFVFLFLSVAALVSAVSCGVVSEKQLDTVKALSAGADSLSNTPASVFRELAEVRRDRGLYYAASLYSVGACAAETENVALQYVSDTVFVRKLSSATSVLSSYLRALRSLASESRWKDLGVEIRGMGRNIDRSVEMYNSIVIDSYESPDLNAAPVSSLASFAAETYMKGRQKRFLRDFVCAGDTLVSGCCDAVSSILKSGVADSLIDYEYDALKKDFRSYLESCKGAGLQVSEEVCREYASLVVRMERIVYVRKRCITAMSTLKRAHARLAESLVSGSGVVTDDVVDGVLEVLDAVSDMEF